MCRWFMFLAVLAACGGDDAATAADATPQADAGPDAAPQCDEVPSCGVEIRVPAGEAQSMSLRGDFDGWASGLDMTRDGSDFVATVPDRPDGRTFQYKLLVDGTTWMNDPGNDRLVPDGSGGSNNVALASCDACPRQIFDWRDATIYFVLIDRYANGDAGNDDPVGVMAPADWQGGDLAGLLAEIQAGSFEDLGVNTLWITSPLANFGGAEGDPDGYQYTAYHGYWPRDPDAVDPHVGDRALLQEVVDTAHAHGLRVVVDYVMNHVHDSSPIYAQHPDWFWPNQNGSGNCVCGQGCSFDSSPERERCWFRPYLPDFDFQVDAARYWSVSNAVRWARDLGLDGFRLDAIKHVERSWGEDLRARLALEVEAAGQPFYLVGETFTGDRELIKSYVGPTQLDGQFDFPWRAAVVSNVLRGEGSMSDLMGFMDGNDGFYGTGAVMSTFLGNHDLPRTVHQAERPPLFDNVWDMGHSRSWVDLPATPTDPDVYQRLAVAYTILLTCPGAPLIYYGDEYGMAGGGDPDNRRMMPWDSWNPEQLALHDQIRALLHLRARTPALRRGRRVTRGSSADGAVYALVDGPTKIFVAVNRGDAPVAATGLPDGLYADLLAGGQLSAPLMIPPRSGLVLQPL